MPVKGLRGASNLTATACGHNLHHSKGVSPKAGRGHATPVQPVQRAKCWWLLNLEPRFEWYHVRARHNALIYRPFNRGRNAGGY